MFTRSTVHNQFKAFCKGVEPAVAYFFKLYNVRIYYFLLKKVKDEALATRMTEDLFKTLFDHCGQIETVDHLLAILYYLAKKCVVRHLQGLPCMDDGRDLWIPPPEEILGIFEDPEIAANEGQHAIQAEIRALSPQRRKVVELKIFHGLDVRAIALELNIVEQTVRNHLSWSKNHLRKRFGDELDLLFP
ncbi:MAG TPA: sigma-70 family RNA polymerase sigma factor [Puia sp.]|jgi:RNA polymerase sigma factor (sigma-70 family)